MIKLRTFDPESEMRVLFDWYNDSDYSMFFRLVKPFLLYKDFYISIASALGPSGGFMTIADESNSPIGFVVIMPYAQERNYEIGVIINKSMWGKEIVIHAMKELGKFVFIDKSADYMTFTIDEEDDSLIKTVEKGGFRHDCTITNSSFYDHKFHNEKRYIMSKPEYLKLYGGQ